jgi:hypothetical protein
MLSKGIMLVCSLMVRLDQANLILLSVMERTKELYLGHVKRYLDEFNSKKKKQTIGLNTQLNCR